MKKLICALAAALVAFSALAPLGKAAAAPAELVLRVHNWQDYIDEDYCFKDGETMFSYTTSSGRKVRVEYTTFGTNEVLYNDMKIGKGDYDLVCPSDYMIEKMMIEDLIDPIDFDNVPNYVDYASPLFDSAFRGIGTEEKNLSHYAVGYMWGTMGFVYNPEKVDAEDLTSWMGAWSEKYKGKMTIKDSVRDTYFMGVAAAAQQPLNQLKTQYLAGEIGLEQYQSSLSAIFNDTSDEMLEDVEKMLREQGKLLYGYELDSGKTDMISGKIDLNFCWSGDAVYTMDQAEYGPDDLTEEELENYESVYFNYAVPEEGSNLWFDGWVIPKGLSAERKEAAEAFLNYLSDPEVAAANMNYIGYTSAIAGDAIFELVNDWYGAEDGAEETYEVDLSYFFEGTLSDELIAEWGLEDGKAVVVTEEIGRQFSAQYPEKSVIDRCVIMRDFGDRNDALLDMWLRVKGNALPLWAILVIVFGAIALGLLVWGAVKLAKAGKFERKPKAPAGYRLIKKG